VLATLEARLPTKSAGQGDRSAETLYAAKMFDRLQKQERQRLR
jgi:hypothetical protein